MISESGHVIGMYAFWDKTSRVYDTPFFCQSDVFADRHYRIVLSREGLIAQFKEDFDLYKLGELDLRSGEYTAYNAVLIHGKKEE